MSHQYLRFDNNASYVRDHYTQEGYRRDYEKCAPTWPIEKWMPLGAGLHVFWHERGYAESFDQFRAFVLETSVSLEGMERSEFRTAAQDFQEERFFFEKRIENAAAEGSVDEHNLRVLEEDLRGHLSRPKRSHGRGRVLFAREGSLRAVWNPSTEKLIGVADAGFKWRLVITPSADAIVHPLDFSEFDHQIRPALSMTLLKEIPLPESLKRAVELFNQKFGGDV